MRDLSLSPAGLLQGVERLQASHHAAAADLLAVAHRVEQSAWTLQVDAGIDRVTVGDHCLYDNVAAWAESLGIVPKRFASLGPGMDRMFSMCRGIDGAEALSTYHVAYMYPCTT